MTFFPFLIGYYVLFGIVLVFDIFVLYHTIKYRYLGPATKYVIILHLVGLFAILIVSHIFIFQIDWQNPINF